MLTACKFSGVGLLVFQSSLYPLVERIIGPIMVSRIAGVSTRILLDIFIKNQQYVYLKMQLPVLLLI